jgi:DTW domain-containing protein YfiP
MNGPKENQSDKRIDYRICPSCRVNFSLCFCKYLKKIEIKTAVDFIMHHREQHLASGTVNLAMLSVSNARIFLRGLQDEPLKVQTIFRADYQPLYLYPREGANILTEEFLAQFSKPIQLIIPDGSWRQAHKVFDREKELHSIPCVTLPETPPSQYHLRKEPFKEGLATFEAMAYALSIIEGVDKIKPLFENFSIMVEQNLKSRNKIRWNKTNASPKVIN